jgi:hypothetical protein
MHSQATSSGQVVEESDLSLDRFFGGDGVDLPALALHLDGLDDTARAAATCRLRAGQQARLFEAAQGFLPLTLEHFVPRGTPPLEQVIHAGRNSLAMFRRFEKRFCSPEAGSARLWGYNENPRSITPVTGPGYFVCYAIEQGQALIDYTEVPPGKPDAWPRILPNSAGLSRYIYNGTQDTMRGVSRHVSIGRAARAGVWMDNWFVLCRREQ